MVTCFETLWNVSTYDRLDWAHFRLMTDWNTTYDRPASTLDRLKIDFRPAKYRLMTGRGYLNSFVIIVGLRVINTPITFL